MKPTFRVSDFNTDLVETSYSTCLCGVLWKAGSWVKKDGSVSQVWLCPACGFKCSTGTRDNRLTRIAKLAPLFKERLSVIEVSRRTGYAEITIRKYFKLFRTRQKEEFKCECGKSQWHEGMCWFRLLPKAVREARANLRGIFQQEMENEIQMVLPTSRTHGPSAS